MIVKIGKVFEIDMQAGLWGFTLYLSIYKRDYWFECQRSSIA